VSSSLQKDSREKECGLSKKRVLQISRGTWDSHYAAKKKKKEED